MTYFTYYFESFVERVKEYKFLFRKQYCKGNSRKSRAGSHIYYRLTCLKFIVERAQD